MDREEVKKYKFTPKAINTKTLTTNERNEGFGERISKIVNNISFSKNVSKEKLKIEYQPDKDDDLSSSSSNDEEIKQVGKKLSQFTLRLPSQQKQSQIKRPTMVQ